MSAETKQSVEVVAAEWRELSGASVQTLQVAHGKIGVIYAEAKPGDEIGVGEMGHVLKRGEWLSNGTGGRSWGRASRMSGRALVAVTEG